MTEARKVMEHLDVLDQVQTTHKEKAQAVLTIGATLAKATARIPVQQMSNKMKLNRLCKSIKTKYAIDDLDCNAFWHKINPDTDKDQRLVIGVEGKRYLFILRINTKTGEPTLHDGYVYDASQDFLPAPFPVSDLLKASSVPR